jgi:predicted nucleic acid-binding protein
MTHGIDTDYLVALEIRDHIYHEAADLLLGQLLDSGHDFAVAPQTLAEFIHVVTDPRRMRDPLEMGEAIQRAESWWESKEVVRLFPNDRSVGEWLLMLDRHRLGRRRLLDTLLAATFSSHGIKKLITNNGSDYEVLDAFEIIRYGNS